MQMGLFKPGQGYWTRVLTAIGAAICFGAAALWGWSELAAFPIPKPTWELTLGSVNGTLSPGQTATLFREGSDGQPVEIGAAEIESVGDGQNSIVVRDIRIADRSEDDMADVSGVATTDVRDVRVVAKRGIPLFEPLYLQAAVAGLIVVLGSALTYYYVGLNRRSCEFLIATDNEMKKVNWSTRKDVIGSTWVVIAAAFLLAAGLFAVDGMFAVFFKWIGVLTN